MKPISQLLLLSFLFLAAGCSSESVKQGIKQGMYEGAVEQQRLNDYPTDTTDQPPSYEQYQDELKRRKASE